MQLSATQQMDFLRNHLHQPERNRQGAEMRKTGILILGWVVMMGCFGRSGRRRKEDPEKAKGKPPVAVEATKVSAADVAEGIEVIGTLAAKFGADVRSEYTGIATDAYVTGNGLRLRRATLWPS